MEVALGNELHIAEDIRAIVGVAWVAAEEQLGANVINGDLALAELALCKSMVVLFAAGNSDLAFGLRR